MKRSPRVVLGAWIGGSALSALLATVRFRTVGEDRHRRALAEGRPIIYALWHGRLLPCTYLNRGRGIAALISQHRDGEYIARVVQRWGYRTVRGSSTHRASAALRELLGELQRGHSVAITPDGPRGPAECVKPGTIHLASLSGSPIVPASAGSDRAWWARSWDRFLIPQPFSRVRFVYGEPLFIPAQLGDGDTAMYVAQLEHRLTEVTREADGLR